MQNVEQTIVSQYANSPTLVQLIQNMNEYIDPQADLATFYSFVWDVTTAQGFGLDIWGKIVNVSRLLNIPGAVSYFGFNEGGDDYQPFGQAPMFNGETMTTVYRLADDAYRSLILVKALTNISDCTVPSLNRILQNMFAGRGRCYVNDPGGMQLIYFFEFALYPYEIAVLTQSGAIPRPAGVFARVVQFDLSTTFGFSEAASYQPFGQGVFFNSLTGIINAS